MRKLMVGMGCAAAMTFCCAAASAQTLYDWPSDEAPALVLDDGAIFFIGKDKSVWRVYKWRATNGKNEQPAFLTDINGDGKPDVVGAGKPTFALDHDSNPIWYDAAGCNQVLVGDFALDDKKDVLCVGRKLEAKTWDYQKIWSISIGRAWDWCVAGDINGDLKKDIECKLRGSNAYSRVDGSTGEMLAAEAEGSEVANPENPNIEPVSADILAGKEQFDIDGDGTAEESLVVDGNAVAIKSRSKKTGLGRLELGSEPVAALVKDVDGDKKLDVIAISKSNVAVWSFGDKEPTIYPLQSSKYKRTPIAELQSVYANGFEDDEAAKKVVKDLNQKLDACYSTQVRKNQFAGVGKTLLEVTVDNTGRVKNVQKHHSSLPDNKVVSCAEGVLKKGSYPKASGDSASVNIQIVYTFRDKT